MDWFKAYMISAEYDEEKIKAMGQHAINAKALQEKVDMFLTDKA